MPDDDLRAAPDTGLDLTGGQVSRPDYPAAARFTSWLRSLDLDELVAYRVEVEAFAGDPTRFGEFAAAALPAVNAVELESRAREELRAEFEPALARDGVEFAEWWANLRAVSRASRQLGDSSDTLEIFQAAWDVSRAAQADIPTYKPANEVDDEQQHD